MAMLISPTVARARAASTAASDSRAAASSAATASAGSASSAARARDAAGATAAIATAATLGLLGLLAALGQAVGSLIARPAMAAGLDPMVASLVRVVVAVLCLGTLTRLPLGAARPAGRLSRRGAAQIGLSGLLAMVIGMTLLLFALQGGKVGIVSTLSALSPVMILPLCRFRDGGITVIGCADLRVADTGAATAPLGLAQRCHARLPP